MSGFTFYSDRNHGPAPRTHESISDETLLGLESLIRRRIDSNWLAGEYGQRCPDGDGIHATDHQALNDELNALIPGLSWPFRGGMRDQDTILDLVEYIATRIAHPSQGQYHSFFRHYELNFDRALGQARFRDDVNLLLARGHTVFEMAANLRVERRGAPETLQALDQLRPATGDLTLDGLIEAGRKGYLSRRIDERQTSVEKLWDAFERLKSLDDPSDKKRSIESLLHNFPDPAWQNVINDEMASLTKLGNSFRIRHSEVSKDEVPTDALDYLVARMSSLLVHLLSASGRLAVAEDLI